MDKHLNKIDFNFKTNQLILNSVSEIDIYKGSWNSLEKKENIYLKELRKITTIESIGSSTRIEGSELSNKEVEDLLRDLKVVNLKTRDEQEVVGYYEALELIYDNYTELGFSENYVKQLHQILLKHSPKDERHRGNYKTLSNQVVANFPDGSQKIIFSPTPVHLVDAEMQSIVSWVNTTLENQEIHPLIVIATSVYEFLSIHPFQDGNGRLSRLLTTWLLLKNDYAFVKYVSFENLIESTKKEYYQALISGQKDRGTKKENISVWVLYFLGRLKDMTVKLDAKYDVFKSKGGYLNERQRTIKNFIEKHQPVRVSDLDKNMSDISINTLKKDLQYMHREKIIGRLGQGKGTVYIIEE